MGIDGSFQDKRMVADGFAGNYLSLSIALGVDECRVGMSLGTQTFHINLSRLQLRLEGVAFTLDQQ